MKWITAFLFMISPVIASSQGKFFGGDGDGFAVSGANNIVLPSTGLTFNGIICQSQVCLDWSTLQESNTSHFIVERRGEGNTFSHIGRIEAAGNSIEKREYSFIDKWPVDGMNYYRLALIDRDGKLTYSPVIHISHHTKKLIGYIANPAGDQLHIRILQPGFITLSIFDMTGKMLKRSVVNSLYTSIDIDDLPDGSYLVYAASGERKEQYRFIKLKAF